MKFKKIVFIIFVILLLIYSAVNIKKEFQNDTFFYIPIGKYIVENGMDGLDHWSFHDNLTYKYAGWFADIVFYKAYSIGGYDAIYGIVVGFAVLTAIAIYALLYLENHSKYLSLLVTFIIMFISRSMFTGRSQIFSFLVFILELYALNKLFEKGQKRYVFVLLLLAFALVIVHDTLFPFYFIFYLPYLAEIMLNFINILSSNSRIVVKKYQNAFLIFALVYVLLFVCYLIGFATPVIGSAYTNLFYAMDGFSTKMIIELQPVHLFEYLPFLTEVFVLIGLIGFTNTKIRLKDLLFVCGFAIFGLLAERNLFYFSLFGTVYLTNILKTVSNDYFGENSIEKLFDRIFDCKIIILLVLMIFASFIVKTFYDHYNEEYIDDLDYPVEATEWIKNNIDYENARIWTHFNFGSWLELNGIKVFIDSRSGMYTVQENPGVTVLEDWYKVEEMQCNYKEIFEKYDITHALFYNDEIVATYVSLDEDYELIYQDDVFSLYERVQED